MFLKIELKSPNIIYKDSFLENIKDYKESGNTEYFNIYKKALDNFEQYVEILDNNSKGIDLPKGYVPCSTFWLVNGDNKVLGVIRIRHKSIPLNGHIGYDIAQKYRGRGYGTKILELALPIAKQLGIDKAILSCKSINIASEKVIKSNNGILFNTIEENGKIYNQFVINL
ncbi:GNAT family N-acetyltransferase [Paeniclostridium sordellii]|nr:GNAT family N-acetyltransferase [Paeniclostridium sordellii]